MSESLSFHFRAHPPTRHGLSPQPAGTSACAAGRLAQLGR